MQRSHGERIYTSLPGHAAAMPVPETHVAAREAYQAVLSRAGYGPITTEIRDAPAFYYAEPYHLADLLRYNLRSVRSYLLKEDFQFFWGYRSPYWAGRFLDQWCLRTMRSKIGPMKRVDSRLPPCFVSW